MADHINRILITIKRLYGEEIFGQTKKFLYETNKLVNTEERQLFLRRCKCEDIVPNFILHKGKCFESLEQQEHPYQEIITRSKRTFFKKLLNLEVKICNFAVRKLNAEVSDLFILLSRTFNDDICREFEEIANEDISSLRKYKKDVLNKKFDKLNNEQNKIKFIYDKTNVINMTNIDIPEECYVVWSFGPQFSFPINDKQIPVTNLLADIENILSYDEINIANEKRAKVTTDITSFLKRKPTPSLNNKILLKAQKVTNKFVKDNQNVYITKSDKGNRTVIINKDEYEQKMTNLLNDSDTYEIIPNDPTKKINAKCFKIMEELKNTNIINNQQKLALKINNPIPPRIYGLPKIHKINVPLRPIVSTINSPGYNLSKFCCKILKPLTQNSIYNIKNSFALKDILNNISLGDRDILASLDVISLFTNIPLAIAKTVISDRWSEISNECKFTKQQFLRTLDICVDENNYFKYKNIFYKQKFGLAMGNPLSPILADIVLEKLFVEKLPLLETQPTFIYKYVDDIFLATNELNLEKIQSIFNTFHGKLKFTVEKENNFCLPFLDIKLHRRNNKITTEWYKKEIASNSLLNYISIHPYHMKRNVAHSFIKRVIYLTDIQFRQNAINKTTNILLNNNYPIKLIQNLITKTLYTYKNRKPKKKDINKYGSLPFIPNLTEKISKILKNNSENLLLANKIIYKTSDTYTKLKDRIPTEDRNGLIYQVKCKDCDACYIGETSKTKAQRMAEHKRDIAHIRSLRNQQLTSFRSALVKHSKEYTHDFDIDNATTLEYENKKNKRLFKEACHIWRAHKPVNYKVDTNKLHSSYINVIKNYTQ